MHIKPMRRALSLLAAAGTAALLYSSAAAFFPVKADPNAAAVSFSKHTTAGSSIAFAPGDFQIETSGRASLDAIVITSLPPAAAGILQLGNQAVTTGSAIQSSALAGLRFYPASQYLGESAFTFLPVFSTHTGQREATVRLHVLSQPNSAPTAGNLSLSTYRNTAIAGQLTGSDPDGDPLAFQLRDRPARGSLTLSEDGSFVYTPYENKTGKDSFSYVVTDPVGNVSGLARVNIRIEKPDTKVQYADMAGSPAHRAAIRLAEEGILVGSCINGSYHFEPEQPVTRSQFLAMAMQAAGVESLPDAAVTGFWDDEAISAWAKPYVASALRAGLIQGETNELGQAVFVPESPITTAQASVLLDRLLQITDVSAPAAAIQEPVPAWAAQSVANLSSCGMLSPSAPAGAPLDRAAAAQLLCAALEVQDSRKQGLFPWL